MQCVSVTLFDSGEASGDGEGAVAKF